MVKTLKNTLLYAIEDVEDRKIFVESKRLFY